MLNWQILVQGRVQGVGFRPFVYRNALDLGLAGNVRNTEQGVLIQVQGPEAALDKFWKKLLHSPPAPSLITGLQKSEHLLQPDLWTFSILDSDQGRSNQVLVSADLAICSECLAELQAEQNRRYMYPFINCTNCGPRLTITASMPYDRSRTSMACFELCRACHKEYNDPRDRRFHAQPNACPDCGPCCWLQSPQGQILALRETALQYAAKALAQSRILALKGLGGFHLACNALDSTTVQKLRKRKQRWGKPLAVMVPNVQHAAKLVEVNAQTASWLQGQMRPVVLAKKQPGWPQLQALAPDTSYLGIMLPYTPLHYILLYHVQQLLPEDQPAILVMTSGNNSSEPIATGNREALSRLQSLADLFLLHNRDILIPCDDSVLAPETRSEKILHIRRSRGFVPTPVFLAGKGPSILGLGAQSKNTVCLTKNDQAFVSQHIGDLQNQEIYSFFQQCIAHLQNMLQTTPEAMVTDLHPDYLSTIYAWEQNSKPVLQLQHHMAHIHSVLAENGYQGPVLGLALDGAGLGLDQTIWGGEFLYMDNVSGQQKRVGHFSQLPMPGSETAILEPWRMAQSYLYALDIKEPGSRQWPWLPEQEKAAQVVNHMLDKGFNVPLTSSCGRLFDAVSALTGSTLFIQYEGQAAVRLENIQDPYIQKPFPCPYYEHNGYYILDTLQLFYHVYLHWQQGVSASVVSRRFHAGLIQGLISIAQTICTRFNLQTVALSGGVLQNMTLLRELVTGLEHVGLNTLLHRFMPPNDACIALGQTVWARNEAIQG